MKANEHMKGRSFYLANKMGGPNAFLLEDEHHIDHIIIQFMRSKLVKENMRVNKPIENRHECVFAALSIH